MARSAWPASLLVLALPVSQEILIGQIHLLLAAAIVLGFRWAGTGRSCC